MGKILRGDVLWADLSPTRGHGQAGKQPILVISHNIFNERSGTVIAMALSSQEQRAGFPLNYELKNADLSKKSWVKISQIRTLSTKRLGDRITTLSPEELDRIIEGLNEIIG